MFSVPDFLSRATCFELNLCALRPPSCAFAYQPAEPAKMKSNLSASDVTDSRFVQSPLESLLFPNTLYLLFPSWSCELNRKGFRKHSTVCKRVCFVCCSIKKKKGGEKKTLCPRAKDVTLMLLFPQWRIDFIKHSSIKYLLLGSLQAKAVQVH